MLSGDLVAPQQNGMLDFRLGSKPEPLFTAHMSGSTSCRHLVGKATIAVGRGHHVSDSVFAADMRWQVRDSRLEANVADDEV
jgi:hypothetical protein